MLGRIMVGSVVRVPLHGRRIRAFVTTLMDEPAVQKVSTVSALVSAEPLFDSATIALARWTADRYVATLGTVLHRAVPGRFSAPPGPGDRPALPDVGPPAWLPAPDAVADVVGRRGGAVVVPGSTNDEPEVVAHAVTTASRRGAASLVIAPRVSVARRVASAIDGAVLLHGEMRPGQRASAWAAARDGVASVIVGTRAALFVPVPDLGLVVVASAHDRSLKEERTPRLHALHVARRRADAARAAFLAVSPAPPLELAELEPIEPSRRPREPRPEVASPRGGPVTERLLAVVRESVSAGRDALVFAGRRGAALRIRCRDCGWYPRCEVCGAGLTALAAALRCRACGEVRPTPAVCGACGGSRLDGAGWGDERVAAVLGTADLPAPVIRVDADAPLPGDRARPAVLVGTIAAAWGLDGASVGAVCVADLDQLLGLPDFRAGEHALGLLYDLAGVLEPGGRFLIQTREPDHHVVQAFTRRSWRYFADRELPQRRAAGLPPASELVAVEGPAAAIDELIATVREPASVLGPLERGRGRRAALVRAANIDTVLPAIRALASAHDRVRVDRDPVDVI